MPLLPRLASAMEEPVALGRRPSRPSMAEKGAHSLDTLGAVKVHLAEAERAKETVESLHRSTRCFATQGARV
jgi:hypothetical protein